MKANESYSIFCLNAPGKKNLVQTRIAQYLLICILLLFVAGALYGQSISSTITGVVVDSQDALVPNAKITATNVSKNIQLKTQTDAEGRFAFAQIQPGTYNITIEAQGFKKLERRGIELSTNTNLPLGEMKLQVGAVSDTVEVTAVGQHLQNESGDRSDTLLNKQVNNIALNSRNYLPLVALVPGVTTATAQGGVAGRGGLNQISVNGIRNNENNLELDGLNNVDTGSNGSQLTTISLDSVEEFRVLTNSYDAQYGHSAGAQILVLSKSGTPTYHGSGYWFHRNDSLNASNWANGLTKGKAFVPGSNNPDGTLKKQKFRLNDLGWTFGGPVQIPKVLTGLKDKMFFFASQEYQRQLAPQGNHFATVPTALERMGDFSQSLDKNGAKLPQLKVPAGAPAGCTVSATNVYSPQCITPLGVNVLNLFPLPTNNTGNNFNFNSAVSNPSPRREDLVRLDYNINDKWKAFARYIHNYDVQTNNYGSFALQAANIPEPITINSPGNGFTVGLTTFVNPTASNELTMGWAQGNISILPATPNLNRTATGLGNFPLLFPNSVQLDTVPVFDFSNAGGRIANSGILGGSNNGAGPFRNGNTTIQVNDNFSKTWGQHLAKFGFFFERSRKDQTNFGPVDARVDFSDGDSQTTLDTGDAFANALLGVYRTYQQASNYIDGKYRYSNYEWYLQDNWKVTRRLTLNYGIRFYVLPQQFEAGLFTSNFLPLRYDPTQTPRLFQPRLVGGKRVACDVATSPCTTAANTLPGFDIGTIVPGSGSLTDGIFQAGKGVSKYLTQNRGVQYAPRFGFAYDVTGQSNIVIRGGGGVYYDRSQGNIIFDELTNPPSIFTPVLSNGFVNNITPLTNLNNTPIGPPGISSILTSAKIPTVYAFNFGIQAKLPYSLVLDTAYVGTTASHLVEKLNLNAVPYGAAFLPQNQDPSVAPSSKPGASSLPQAFVSPFRGYGTITQYQSTGSSNFNSLQVSLNRRYAKGLFLGVAYTYGKSLGITSNDTDFVRIDNLNRQQNYGPLAIDRRHTVAIQYIYDIPGLFAKSSWLHSTLDGWQISGVTRLQSGAPYEVTATVNGFSNQNITGSFTEGSRVQQVLGDPFAGVNGDVFHRINPLAFAPPPVGNIGLGEKRNPFIGPGINNTDLSLQKTFGLGERFSLQTRIDAFNAFNHPQFTGINSSINYTTISGGNALSNISNLADPVTRQNGFGSVNGARDPRVLQLMVRLVF